VRDALRNPAIRRFAALQFLLDVQFWFPVYLIYLLDLGFDLVTAVLADGVFRFVSAVLEVPMGIVADRLGRRRSQLLLTATTVVTFVAITRIETVGELLAVWVLWGVLWALSSGAAAAYLYELSVQEAPGLDPARAFGLVRVVQSLALLLSLLAAGYLYEAEPTLPFLLTAGMALVAVAVAWTLPDIRLAAGRPTVRSVLGEARTALSDRRVRIVVALGALLLVAGWSPRMLLQPLTLELGYSAEATGWVYAVFAGAAVVAGLLAGRVGASRRRPTVTLAFGLVLGSLVATTWLPWLGPFLFLPVLGFAYALALTLLEVVTSEVTPQRVRTTVLSVVSFVGGLGIALTRPPLGLVADEVSATAAFGISAALAAVLVAAAVLLLRRLAILEPNGQSHGQRTVPARVPVDDLA
jgi:MFS family permease